MTIDREVDRNGEIRDAIRLSDSEVKEEQGE